METKFPYRSIKAFISDHAPNDYLFQLNGCFFFRGNCFILLRDTFRNCNRAINDGHQPFTFSKRKWNVLLNVHIYFSWKHKVSLKLFDKGSNIIGNGEIRYLKEHGHMIFVSECQYRHHSGLNFFLVQFAVMILMWPYVAQYH